MFQGFNNAMITISVLFILFSSFSTVFVFIKYKQRQNPLIGILTKLFFFYTLYLVFNITALSFTFNYEQLIRIGIQQIITFPFSSTISSNPQVIGYIIFYMLDLTFATSTTIIANQFRMATFEKHIDSNNSFTKFVKCWGIVTIIAAICSLISINQYYLSFVGFLITFHIFLVYGLFTRDAYRTYNLMKTTDENKIYKQAFIFIGLMPFFFILRNICLYLDQIVLYLSGVEFPAYSVHSEFVFIAWVFLVLAYFAAFLGYIRPAMKKS